MPSTWTYGCVPTVESVTATTSSQAVVDLAYNAGAGNLWEDRDSRAVNAEIVQWAEEFETEHAGTDWDAEDYFLAIDRFYKEKTKQMNPVTIPAN